MFWQNKPHFDDRTHRLYNLVSRRTVHVRRLIRMFHQKWQPTMCNKKGKSFSGHRSTPKRCKKDAQGGGRGIWTPVSGFPLRGGATSPRINESSLQLIINCQQTHFQSFSITGARQSARLAYTPGECESKKLITSCASLLLSFFFSFSSCAISNAGYRVSSRRVSLSSWWLPSLDLSSPKGCILGGPVGIRTRGVWLRRPALYPG